MAQLVEYDKKFLIIGNKNAITYKETFSLIQKNEMWIGYTTPEKFSQPNNTDIKCMSGLTRWFTNLEIKKLHEDIILYKKYNPIDYPKYDNYDAINVDKTKDIPVDYDGVMGVPITFMDKYNPGQFEIVGIDRVLVEKLTGKVSRFRMSDKEIYARIIIKKKVQ